MMNLHWIIDVDIIGEEHTNVPAQLCSLGYRVTTLSAAKDFPKLIPDHITIFPFHGSFEELHKVKKIITPTTYGLGPSILRSHYTSYLPQDWFLNKDSTMTTWGSLCNSIHLLSRHHAGLFIRPDSGNKTFTGQVITREKFDDQKSILEQFSNIKPETIIWFSEAKTIENEYRFWISNGRVITCCEYSWEKEKTLGNVPNIAMRLAEKIAEYEWQLDRIYVVDIAIIYNNYPCIIEFNSFSCSGLYSCDSEKLFKTVSHDIISEWEE